MVHDITYGSTVLQLKQETLMSYIVKCLQYIKENVSGFKTLIK